MKEKHLEVGGLILGQGPSSADPRQQGLLAAVLGEKKKRRSIFSVTQSLVPPPSGS